MAVRASMTKPDLLERTGHVIVSDHNPEFHYTKFCVDCSPRQVAGDLSEGVGRILSLWGARSLRQLARWMVLFYLATLAIFAGLLLTRR
jgi:hypothetical protein